MERIGEEYVRKELVFTPAKCEVYEHAKKHLVIDSGLGDIEVKY